MKRRGGDGGRTMVVGADDEGRTMGSRTTEMEHLCSKLMSLVPEDYQLDNPQGSSDLPGQLMQAASYINDLRERVEKLKQRRDDCYAKILQVTKCSCSNIANEAAYFDVNFTLNSDRSIELYKVIHAIEQDQCIEIIKASSCMVEDNKIAYTIKCRARSSDVVLDAPMVTTRLRRLFTE
ncbi:hypothetical protein EJB05_44850, partial [Eragrostis curvula]